MEWNKLSIRTKANILAGETTVMVSLLAECEELVEALKNGSSKEECLKIINDTFLIRAGFGYRLVHDPYTMKRKCPSATGGPDEIRAVGKPITGHDEAKAVDIVPGSLFLLSCT